MLEVLLDRRIEMNGFALYIRDRNYMTGKNAYATEVVMDNVKSGIIPPHVAVLSYETIQRIMNDLWVAGIRPDEGLVEPRNLEHLEKEIDWLRSTFTAMLAKTLFGQYKEIENAESLS